MERVLPKTVDYLDVLPRAIPAERKRKKFYPANGTQYTEGQTIIIELADPRHFLDPSNSYLQFTYTNLTGQSMSFDFGGGDTLIRNLRVHQAGNQIMDIQEYNRLMCGIINPVFHNRYKENEGTLNNMSAGDTNITVALGRTNATAGADNTSGKNSGSVYTLAGNAAAAAADRGMLADGESVVFSIPLTGGLFSQAKLIPLPLLREPIQVILDLETNIQRLGVYGADPVAGNGYRISNVSYVSELIDVPRDVLSMLRQVQEMNGGSLLIQANSFEFNNGNIPAGSTGEVIVNIPTRKKSIKSVLFCGQGPPTSLTTGFSDVAGMTATGEFSAYTLSQSSNFLLRSYQIKAGSLVHPPQPVRGPGGLGQNGLNFNGQPNCELARGEPAEELSKAFGFLGTTIGNGILNTLTYAPIKRTAPIAGGGATVVAVGSDMVKLDGTPIVRIRDITGGTGARAAAPPNELTASGRPSNMEFAPFGLDFEAFQKEAVNSGLNTESLALSMDLVLDIDNPSAVAGERQEQQVNLDIYTWYDIIYYINMDGTITYSQ
tara:strand:+ start:2097 stop:3737 length:1641 start_codon:yes stop_codon:yes gene_type:complete